LRTRKWQDTEGRDRYSTEIIVDNFIFLDSKSSNNDEGDDTKKFDEKQDSNVNVEDEEVPF